MKNPFRLSIVSISLLIALLFAAILPSIALADEGEPPPTPTEEAPAEEAPPVEEPTEQSGESAAPAEDPAVENPDSTGLSAEDETSSSEPNLLLAEVPEGTEVIVLDETGESVPLASEEAASILMDGDPMWCPSGVTPGGAGCTTNYATFALLLGDAVFGAAGPSVNGVIWVRDNYAGADAAAITINGDTLANTNMQNFSLTIKGGWTGVGTTIDTGSPSAFDVALSIINWNADVTLSDITIDAGNVTGLTVTTTKNINLTRVSSNNNTGGLSGRGASLDNGAGTGNVTVTGGTFNGNSNLGGLLILSNGNITLSGVTASGNAGTGFGAWLDNTTGTGNISVTNSTFSGNTNQGGLRVLSNGTITLNGITASGNTGTGVFLNNSLAAMPKNVTVMGVNTFSGNSSGGISVNSKGMVSLTGVTASSNAGSQGGSISNTAGTLGVSITNSTFSSNTATGGLYTESNGAITLNNVTANSNFGYGTFLDNDAGTSGVTITTGNFNGNSGVQGGLYVISFANVSLTSVHADGNSAGNGAQLNNIAGTGNVSVATSSFNSNLGTGLFASSNGTITLTSSTANSNSTYGAYLLNDAAATPKTVTVAGVGNQFNGNSGSDGIYVSSDGAISLTSITANSNGGIGVYLNNFGGNAAITLTTATANTNSGSGGIYVTTKGSITFTNVTSNQNTGYGAWLTNSSGSGNISVSGTFNQNGGSGGLIVSSAGTITLNSVTASSNTNSVGASLDNTLAATAKAVTLNGTNEFSSNRQTGLAIDTGGAVTINNLSANYNGLLALSGSGLNLNNTYGTAVSGVTMNGTNIFLGNYTNGLTIYSDGAIKLNNVTANSNSHGWGATLDNTTAATPQSVMLTGSNFFKFNRDGGLFVYSDGLISVNSITANSNGPSTVSGAYLDNANVGSTAGITLTGINTFIDNAWFGLNTHSRGPISVSSVTANGNGLIALSGSGVLLDNQSAVTFQPVTLSGTNSFDGNYATGLSVTTRGAITVNSVTSINNLNSNGVTLNNTFGAFTNSNMPVTVNGTNVFSNNDASGMEVTSYGAITLNNVTAKENGITGGAGFGIYLDNYSADTPKTVTINGVNNTSENQDTGLYVFIKGLIKINSLTANDNGTGAGDYGANLNNAYAGTTAGITLTGTNSFSNNAAGGLLVNSNGLISMNSITASDNQASHGVIVDNTSLGISNVQNVTISGTNVFNSNYFSGLDITTYGAISLNNVTAVGNGTSAVVGFGAYLYNAGADPLKPLKGITITGTNHFDSNFDGGLVASSLGTISGNNLNADGNGTTSDNGIYLDNTTAPTPTDVKLTGINSATDNHGPGISIFTDGAVTVNSLAASGNGLSTASYGAIISVSSGDVKNVTLTGTNVFNGNGFGGLSIQTRGAIAVSNVTANNNVGYTGLYLDNVAPAPDNTMPRNITVSGVNSFSDNGLSGLYIESFGAISISSVTANGNSGYGAYLLNNGSLANQNVTLLGSNKFDDNWYGIYVSTKGTVTSATGLSATNSTAGTGASILNNAGDGTAVTLGGTNVFTGNWNTGLNVLSEGTLTLNNVTATGNGLSSGNGFGVGLDNDNDPLKLNNVTLTGVNNFSDNYTGGLLINSRGNISASNITASNTVDGVGAEMYNDLTEGKTVTLSGTNAFNENDLQGLMIGSKGGITLNNLTVKLNGIAGFNAGVVISNSSSTAAQFVKLNGTNIFNENGATGLVINSNGAITTNNVTAIDNGSMGAYLNNDFGGFTGGVTMTGVNSFLSNTAQGLWISSNGVVSLSKITSDGNGGLGVLVSTDGNVTITCASITNNGGGVGLQVSTLGLLTLKGVVSAGQTTDLSLAYGTLTVIRTC